MTGYKSKRAAARDKLDDDDTLTIAYQAGFYDGKKAAQPPQEPVAWLCSPDENGLFNDLPTTHKACKDCFPVYTAPPQRPWVGLTAEEMYLNCPNWLSQEQCKVWIQQIEAKLKEKNT